MAEFFPLFRRAAKSTVLVIGDNKEALEKAKKLSAYPFNIEFYKEKISDIPKLLSEISPDIVILADKTLCCANELYETCVKKRIEINAVDDAENSTFIFPSLITKGKLAVAISTDGACPAVAAKLRKNIESDLPADIDAIIDQLAELRRTIKAEDKRRIMRALCDAAFEKKGLLCDEEIDEIIKR